MEYSPIEKVYHLLDDITLQIEKNVAEPYINSLAYAMECLYFNEPADWMEEDLSQKISEKLSTIQLDDYEQTDVHKGIQFAIIKGMKDSVQPQHAMTPESIALTIGYLADKLMSDKESIRIFDPAVGTGNLLFTVMNQLKQVTYSYGSEVDESLLRLNMASANFRETPVELFHQDSLQPFLLDPVDLVVADLPVGYYPDDVRAKEYELERDNGHSYAHHLFIEQSLNYTKAKGYNIFVIPEFLFDDDAKKLQTFLQKEAHIVGVLRLPEDAFKNEKQGKSILVLQKKGTGTTTPKTPLLVQLPSLKDTGAWENVLVQIDRWFDNYLPKK